MAAVFGDTRYVVVLYGAGDADIVMVKSTCPFVESVHALSEGADPKVIPGVVVDAHHPVIGEAGRIFRIMSVVDEFFSIEAVQPSKIATYPQLIIFVHLKADDNVV